jgi:glutamate-1-semialdehyde 2,1-aminomutase
MPKFFSSSIKPFFVLVNNCNLGNHSKFFQTILDQGIMFPPSQYETIFISNSHTDEDIERTAEICIKALKKIIL